MQFVLNNNKPNPYIKMQKAKETRKQKQKTKNKQKTPKH